MDCKEQCSAPEAQRVGIWQARVSNTENCNQHCAVLAGQAPGEDLCCSPCRAAPYRLPHQSDNGEMLEQPQAQLLLRVLTTIQAPGLRWKGELAFDHCLVWTGKETG